MRVQSQSESEHSVLRNSGRKYFQNWAYSLTNSQLSHASMVWWGRSVAHCSCCVVLPSNTFCPVNVVASAVAVPIRKLFCMNGAKTSLLYNFRPVQWKASRVMFSSNTTSLFVYTATNARQMTLSVASSFCHHEEDGDLSLLLAVSAKWNREKNWWQHRSTGTFGFGGTKFSNKYFYLPMMYTQQAI